MKLKPGDVVELVAWEDGSTHGIGNRYPFDGFPNEPRGERPLFRVVSRSQSQPVNPDMLHNRI
jgi:hypothetical protein